MEFLYMFRQLWHYADRERWKVIIYLIMHAISMLGELGKPYAFAMVINALQRNDVNVIEDVLKWLGFYVLCFFVFEVFHRGARFIERYVAFRNRKRFTTTMYEHLQSLPLSWHGDNHSGAVIDRVNKAATGLQSFGESQFVYVSFVMNFFGPLILLWVISPNISLVTIASGCLLVYITKKMYNMSVPAYRNQNESLHKLASALFDYINNIRTIIMLRLGPLAKKDIDSRTNEVFPHLHKENVYTQIKCFISSFIIIALEVGVIFYYIVSQKSSGEVILIGTVTAIFQYLQQCMSSFQFYSGGYESVIHWKTDFEAVKPILVANKGVQEYNDHNLENWETLAVHDLNFSYEEGEHQLSNIQVQLQKGKKIAFIGESGAGKSTLLQLLRGLIPIHEGELIKDNHIKLPFASLAGTTTLVPQEPEIFENTVHYNITMGVPASDEEVNEAIWTACFSEVADKLPHGLDSDIREKGVNLSGGQKQRLALARGIFSIRDSNIILLDEPTSNVDPATEMMIFKRLFDRLEGKCVISVLHRLHLLRMFDYVYVFKEGRIVEKGTFNELSENSGEFSRLWKEYLVEEETPLKPFI